jgi:hypothetical protein
VPDEALLAADAAVSHVAVSSALHIAPAALSQRVKLLKELIGAVLIVRGQPCSATEIDARICRHGELVSVLLAELWRELPTLPRSTPDTLHASLRIAVNANSIGTWFIHGTAEFWREDAALLNLIIANGATRRSGLAAGTCSVRSPRCKHPFRGVGSGGPGRCVTWPRRVAASCAAGSDAASPPRPWPRRRAFSSTATTGCRRPGGAVPCAATWPCRCTAFPARRRSSMPGSPRSAGVRTRCRRSAPSSKPVPWSSWYRTLRPTSLYWQAARLKVPVLERLTRSVVRAATAALQRSVASSQDSQACCTRAPGLGPRRALVRITPPTTTAPPMRVAQPGRSPSHAQLINSAMGVEK